MPTDIATPAEATDALVIGAGPAGLMAAEMLAAAGARVIVADRMPSVGRKFLMAGKSGLNLTKMEDGFAAAYGPARMAEIVQGFGPEAVRGWAAGLGQATFAGSTGRVFPEAMKASPLLRAWLARLASGGVSVRTRHRWTGWTPDAGGGSGAGGAATFVTPDGAVTIAARVTVLALGGASWSRLGSDGAWSGILAGAGIALAPFRPANGGLRVAWSGPMQRHLGAPVKGVRLTAGPLTSRGEMTLSREGLEGGGLYEVYAAVRDGTPLILDLVPDLDVAVVAERLARPRGRARVAEHLRKRLRLDPVRLALLQEFGRPLPDGAALARLVKALPVRHGGPRPMDEAISTAGGIAWDALTDALELTARPGVFAAGEMLDWEAVTGGYLITGCLATGRRAGLSAAARI